jgi:twitching motility protein PilJ
MRNALSNNPQLVSVLGEGMSPARAITASAVELTRRDVLSKRYTLEPSLYLDQLSRPIEAHFALQNSALAQLDDLLEVRLAQLANQQTLSLFIVAATLLLSLWLIIGVANSILAPLRELTRVALNLGQGNLSTLAHLCSSDELGLVGKTLNQSILTLRSLMEQQEAERPDLTDMRLVG